VDLWQAVILSIVEGLTEFLPISSTGHLVLTAKLLGITQTEFVKNFEIFIQLGAILAVVVLYFKKYIKNPLVWKRVLTAFIPTGIIGLVLYRLIKNFLLGNELITVLALLIGGILLIILEKVYKEQAHHKTQIEEISFKQALGIGLIQSLSIIPGVSRAAASILGGMFLGLKRGVAVEFSFLLAVPTILAASGFDLLESGLSFSSDQWFVLIVGLISSFIVALIVIKWFIKYVQTKTLIPFGIYRIMIAILYLIFILK
jgi:undecaprenyl-diphosphatase